jgi:hypothetical protein
MIERHMRAVPAPAGGPPEVTRHWLESATPRDDGEGLVHVVATAEDPPRVAPVIWAIEEAAHFEQRVLAGFAGAAGVLEALNVRLPVTELVPTGLMEKLELELAGRPPVAVVIHGEGEVGLAASIVAARQSLAVVRVGRASDPSPISRALARVADLLLVPDEDEREALKLMRIGAERIHVVGNPLVGAVRRFVRQAAERETARAHGVSPGAYVLAVRTGVSAWPVTTDLPVVTVVAGAAAASGGRVVRDPSFIDRLSLERSAALIVTDSERAMQEAAALGVPCRTVGVQKPAGPAIPLRDGRAGRRIAEVVVANFARVRLG